MAKARPTKTKMVVVTNRRKLTIANINKGKYEMASKRCLKYLGLIKDDHLIFRDHIDCVCNNTSKVHAALVQINPNR